MEERNIDRTHILALQEVNGMLNNVEFPITRPEQYIAELEAMIGNPNRTVWDMQSFFTTRFPKSNTYMDYIHPYSYNSSYVGGIGYPTLKGYNELRLSWESAGTDARESYLATCKQTGTTPDALCANQKEVDAINSLKKSQKSRFFNDAIRWIDASCYYDASIQLNRDSSVKMFSKENIGWNHFTHRVNDDINVALRTNFGFGSSAYFMLAVQYKGIDILPYSYIVKYYKAGMADIIRCTRSYSPCRASWSASFDFLSEFVNNSIADPEGFVESYIMNEVTEMMRGLESIAINPKGFMERIGNKKADPCVINVRPMFGDDRTRMQSYPEETPILFKVEKIVGALDFLKNLTEIAKEVSMVQPHINRLLELNMALYPEVQSAVVKISDKVTKQKQIKKALEIEIAALSEKLAPFEKEVEKLRSDATKENPFSIIGNYELAHPDYKKFKDELNDKTSRLYSVNRLISDLESFLSILNCSLSKVDDVRQNILAA